MIDLDYSLIIEATEDPSFFCYYSPDLLGFTGAGKSLEDCISKVKSEMDEFISFVKEMDHQVPRPSRRPYIKIVNAPKGRPIRTRVTA